MSFWNGPSSAAPASPRSDERYKRRCAMVMLITLLCFSTWARPGNPRLLWNASPSVPIGLYLLVDRPAAVGALAVVRLPEPILSLADARGYLPAGALLIKGVFGRTGDVVCRWGVSITIDGRAVARARSNDAARRPLPGWSGCRRLTRGQVLLLASEPDSFDSRYFGPIARSNVVGTALPIWVRGRWAHCGHALDADARQFGRSEKISTQTTPATSRQPARAEARALARLKR
jgi:conjugative transfer signal peptidase TraF